jgi:cation:H+ antiporter
MLLNLALVVGGLIGLFFGGEWLVKGAARLASSFGVPALIVGLTVVAWGTSAPELVVNINAALQGSTGFALGNILGSNIVNVGLTLGIMALIIPITVDWQLIRREIPIMIITACIMFLLSLDGEISQGDGILLVLGFLFFNVLMLFYVAQERRKIEPAITEYCEEENLIDESVGEKGDFVATAQVNRIFEIGRIAVGLALLILGSNWTIEGGTAVARTLGVSDFIIGLTLIAVGTSLPELSTALVAAMRKEGDIALGNIIGSNIANILAILGVTAAIQPIAVPANLMLFEMPVLIGFSLVVLVFAFDRIIRRVEAGLLTVAYIGFIAFSVLR